MTSLTGRASLKKAIGLFASFGLVFALAAPSLAAHVDPVEVEGNPTCGDLGDFDHEFKIEPVSSGTYNDGDFEVEITVYDTDDGQVFDFSANQPVQAVFAKGGNTGNLYDYGAGETSDTGLHAPVNPSGKWAGLSHISFCFGDVEETPTPTPTPTEEETPTPTPTEEETPTPTPTEEELGGTPTPTPREDTAGGTPTPTAGEVPDTAMSDWSQVPATVLSLILLASLGAMLYVRLAHSPIKK